MRAQQQRNSTATQFDASEFFVRRLEEYERTCVLTSRIQESYGQEICLIGYLHQLLGSLNKLRCHFEGIAEEAERDIDSFEESATPAIVSRARNEGVGRPRLALAQEQLRETLHKEAGFRWADVARILGVSERTVRRRRLEFGLPVGRHILRSKPSSGRRFVQGELTQRNRGKILVSKETVVLRRWEIEKEIDFIKRVDKGRITTEKDLES